MGARARARVCVRIIYAPVRCIESDDRPPKIHVLQNMKPGPPPTEWNVTDRMNTFGNEGEYIYIYIYSISTYLPTYLPTYTYCCTILI